MYLQSEVDIELRVKTAGYIHEHGTLQFHSSPSFWCYKEHGEVILVRIFLRHWQKYRV